MNFLSYIEPKERACQPQACSLVHSQSVSALHAVQCRLIVNYVTSRLHAARCRLIVNYMASRSARGMKHPNSLRGRRRRPSTRTLKHDRPGVKAPQWISKSFRLLRRSKATRTGAAGKVSRLNLTLRSPLTAWMICVLFATRGSSMDSMSASSHAATCTTPSAGRDLSTARANHS